MLATQFATLAASLSALLFAPPDVFTAAAEGDQVVARRLLAEGGVAVLETRDEDGNTPLHVAASMGHAHVVELFLDAKNTVHLQNRRGASPLYLAAAAQQEKVIEPLLRHGADPSQPTKSDDTPLDVARQSKNQRMIDAMLLFDIHYQAGKGNDERVRAILEIAPNRANAFDRRKNTPLHAAAIEGAIPVIRILLSHKADPNAANEDSYTPLHDALTWGHLDAAKILIRAGAKADIFAAVGLGDRDAMQTFIKGDPQAITRRGGLDFTPLHWVVRLNQAELLDDLLHAETLDAQEHNGVTPLHMAAGFGRIDIATRLLDAGAEPNIADARGDTPLHAAAARGDTEMIQLLLGRGAWLQAVNKEGKTPVHFAVENRREDAVKFLASELDAENPLTKAPIEQLIRAAIKGDRESLDRLLNKQPELVNERARNGTTPLYWAAGLCDEESVRLLMRRGADPAIKIGTGRRVIDSACRFTDPTPHPSTALIRRLLNERLPSETTPPAGGNLAGAVGEQSLDPAIATYELPKAVLSWPQNKGRAASGDNDLDVDSYLLFFTWLRQGLQVEGSADTISRYSLTAPETWQAWRATRNLRNTDPNRFSAPNTDIADERERVLPGYSPGQRSQVREFLERQLQTHGSSAPKILLDEGWNGPDYVLTWTIDRVRAAAGTSEGDADAYVLFTHFLWGNLSMQGIREPGVVRPMQTPAAFKLWRSFRGIVQRHPEAFKPEGYYPQFKSARDQMNDALRDHSDSERRDLHRWLRDMAEQNPPDAPASVVTLWNGPKAVMAWPRQQAGAAAGFSDLDEQAYVLFVHWLWETLSLEGSRDHAQRYPVPSEKSWALWRSLRIMMREDPRQFPGGGILRELADEREAILARQSPAQMDAIREFLKKQLQTHGRSAPHAALDAGWEDGPDIVFAWRIDCALAAAGSSNGDEIAYLLFVGYLRSTAKDQGVRDPSALYPIQSPRTWGFWRPFRKVVHQRPELFKSAAYYPEGTSIDQHRQNVLDNVPAEERRDVGRWLLDMAQRFPD